MNTNIFPDQNLTKHYFIYKNIFLSTMNRAQIYIYIDNRITKNLQAPHDDNNEDYSIMLCNTKKVL